MVWPRAMEMSTPCTAFTAPNDFLSPEMAIQPWASRSLTAPAKARAAPTTAATLARRPPPLNLLRSPPMANGLPTWAGRGGSIRLAQ